MRSNGECDLHPQQHPIVDKVRRLDDFHSFDYISYESVMDSLEIPLFAFLLQLVSRVIFFRLPAFYHIDVHDVFPS